MTSNVNIPHSYSTVCITREVLFVNHLCSAPSQGCLWQYKLGFERDTLWPLPLPLHAGCDPSGSQHISTFLFYNTRLQQIDDKLQNKQDKITALSDLLKQFNDTKESLNSWMKGFATRVNKKDDSRILRVSINNIIIINNNNIIINNIIINNNITINIVAVIIQNEFDFQR